MATLPQILFETLLISLGRASLFYACRNYLLRSLYYDLRHLSSSSSLGAGLPPTPGTEGASRTSETELDDLPAPATTPRTPSSHFTSSSNQQSVERTWHSSLSRATFSLCFSESCTLFLLVLSQAMNLFSTRARHMNWQISLALLISTILLVAPLLECLLLTYRTSSKEKVSNQPRRSLSSHLILTGVPYGLYLLMLSYIPLPSQLESSQLTTATLSRLIVLGTLILGILAGFGATSAVFSHFQLALANRQPVSDSEIVAAEQALFRVRSDLLERQHQVERNTASEPEAQGGFFSSLNLFSGNTELSSLKREIQGLEALEFHMSRNLEFLQRRRAATRFSGTFGGRVWTWVGRLFALYCAFRVISSIINLVSPYSSAAGPTTAPSSPDLIAQLLARVVSLFLPVSEKDIAAGSRQVSLLLVGAIILSSVRRTLGGVARVLKVTSKNLAASLLLLILAQLMGTYLLSTLIQLRTSFPAPSSDTEDSLNLFATLPEYHVFGPLWDGAFLVSVGVSGAVRWLDDRVNGPGL